MIEYPDGGRRQRTAKLVSCPFCGEEFPNSGGMARVTHLTKCPEKDA